MKFVLDYQIQLEAGAESLSRLLKDEALLEKHREELSDVQWVEGALTLDTGVSERTLDFSDPVIRFAESWLKKLPWIIGGDTETVALRNSEECFAFVPNGDGVEISFFEGDESEIEEYIMEPLPVMLENLVQASLDWGREVLDFAERLDPEVAASNEDCKDLKESLLEADKSWKEHLRQKR